jgi:ribA/ribD-fused uncharacterized protein
VKTINFYRVGDEFGLFSNFAPYPIEVDGNTWPTTEHYFQAQKFPGNDHAEAIRREPSPMIAARMGRDRSKPLRPDWEQAKDDIMRTAVRAKVAQYAEVRAALIETGDAQLVEHTKNDAYWGDGGDGSGKNMLGIILMEIRDEMRQANPASHDTLEDSRA